MPVYPVEFPKTSCAAAGCPCRDRTQRYPSDLTDEQWKLLSPEVEAVMAQLRRGPGGRAMVHDLRAVLDAIGYVTRYGIEWRALPADSRRGGLCMPFFQRWSQRGMPQRLVGGLRGRLRVAWGRAPLAHGRSY
ncbi:transposase [Mycobacterium riyadhense]|uniref:transposase n=1 Tax=Mycobacterium riyadhense TaxID=486698 RepID=UPI001EF9E201|nr:transposase [Mycobacterium riyadhense]